MACDIAAVGGRNVSIAMSFEELVGWLVAAHHREVSELQQQLCRVGGAVAGVASEGAGGDRPTVAFSSSSQAHRRGCPCLAELRPGQEHCACAEKEAQFISVDRHSCHDAGDVREAREAERSDEVYSIDEDESLRVPRGQAPAIRGLTADPIVTVEEYEEEQEEGEEEPALNTNSGRPTKDLGNRETIQMFDRPGKHLTLFTMMDSSDNGLVIRIFLNLWHRYTKHVRAPVDFHLNDTWEDIETLRGSVDEAADRVVHSQTSAKITTITTGSASEDADIMPEHELIARRTSMVEAYDIIYSHGMVRCVLHPNSNRRMYWDVLCLVLLLYDFIIIPLRLVFGLPSTSLLQLMDMATLLFWTADMFMSCVTGFNSQDATILQPREILKHYFKGWFMIDLLIISPDWCLLAVSQQGRSGTGFARILRTARVARFLRIAKLQRLMAMVRDRIDSEMTFIVLTTIKLLSVLLLLNHLVASIWYAIGNSMQGHDVQNWIDVDQEFRDQPVGYRYATALHWSLTQFTPASMEVQPQNVLERIFAIVILLLGMVLFSGFVSTITASLTQLGRMQEDYSKEIWLLRRYLRHNKVPNQLTFRVLRYVEYAAREEKSLIPENRIHLLGKLSDQLKNELRFCVCFSSIATHPLFERASCISTAGMKQLSSEALTLRLMVGEEVIFGIGSIAKRMYVIDSGEVIYGSPEIEPEIGDSLLQGGDWLSEAVLWATGWIHVGSAITISDVKMVCLDPIKFGTAIKNDIPTYTMMSHYARNFLTWLNGKRRRDLTDAFTAGAMQPVVSQFIKGNEGDRSLFSDLTRTFVLRRASSNSSSFRSSL